MATQAFSKWVLLLEFRWNQDYIAATLCENRKKPKLKCGGKCQLAKMMAKEEKDSSPFSNHTSKIKFTEHLFSFQFSDVSTTPSQISNAEKIISNEMFVSALCNHSIFRPPRA